MALAFLSWGPAPNLPMRWWPVFLVQGLLGTIAYFFFFFGGEGEDAAIAAVASSALMVIGVLLGVLFLEEKVSLKHSEKGREWCARHQGLERRSSATIM